MLKWPRGGTVVGETLTVFSIPQIWKTGQCFAGQCFADYCILYDKQIYLPSKNKMFARFCTEIMAKKLWRGHPRCDALIRPWVSGVEVKANGLERKWTVPTGWKWTVSACVGSHKGMILDSQKKYESGRPRNESGRSQHAWAVMKGW